MSPENIVALVGNDCSTNRSVGDITEISLIECASNRLQLAVRDFLSKNEPILQQVHTLMVNLRTSLTSAIFEQYFYKKEKNRNVFRWTSTFGMLIRHVCFRQYLPEIYDDLVESLLLNHRQERKVDGLLD